MVTTRSVSRSAPSTPVPTCTSLAGNALQIDPVSKARTIAHMNKDHGEDMTCILRHYGGLGEEQAAGAQMEDLDLATMSIRSKTGLHTVNVTPPMSHWSERRARMVEMTHAAKSALGMEVVDEVDHAPGAVHFYAPEGWGILSFAGVVWYFISAAAVFTGNMKYDDAPFCRFLVAVHSPISPELYRWLVTVLVVPMLLIHIAEAFYMAKSRLSGSVSAGSFMWWLWVINAFFEGAPCWNKWDRRVLGKRKVE